MAKSVRKWCSGSNLVINNGHVEVAQLLQRIGQIGVGLRHVGIQQYAAVIESDALTVMTQLVIDGPNQEEKIRPV